MKIKKIKVSKNKKPSEGFIVGSGYACIDDVLEETRGTLPFQETIMRLYASVCDVDFGDADKIRKIIGKKMSMSIPAEAKIILAEKTRWMDGCKIKGIDEQTAETWWHRIIVNAEYSFNKSHSDAYSVLTYETLFYRWAYPLEYIAVRMSIKPEEQAFWLQKAAELGYTVLPPNVSYSHASEYTIHDGKLLMPIVGLKGMGLGAAMEIVNQRPYTSIQDFRSRVPRKSVTAAKIFTLYMMGAFDGIAGDFEDLDCDRTLTKLPSGWYDIVYKKGKEIITTEIRCTYDKYSQFLNNAILYSPSLAKKLKDLQSRGYSVGVITDIQAGETQTGKGNHKYYFGQSFPSLYIGDWALPKVEKKLGRELLKGDYIAYEVNKKFGRYLNDENVIILNDLV